MLPWFIWLIIVILACIPLVYFSDYFCRHLNPGEPSCSAKVAVFVIIAAWLPFINTAVDYYRHGMLEYRIDAIALSMDGLGLLLTTLVMTLGTLVVIFSMKYMAATPDQNRYYALLFAMLGTTIGLASATDLFNLWVWYETMAIASYVLVVFHRHPTSLEAGIKYIFQGAVGTVLILLGIALILLEAGTLSFANLTTAATPSTLRLAAGGLFVVGFGVKAAIVPMHTWLPDAHSQAPGGVSALLSGIVIEAGLVAMLRTINVLFAASPSWAVLIAVFALLNMFFGNFLAVRQQDVKRLLAYSSIVHMGYMLFGVAISMEALTTDGIHGTVFHIMTHGVMKTAAFLAAGMLLYVIHASDKAHTTLAISDLSGAAQKYPLLAASFSIALFALGGLPPMAGFMSEWQIFSAGIRSGSTAFSILTIVAGLNSVFSLSYYLPLIGRMYHVNISQPVLDGVQPSYSMIVPISIAAVATVLIGLWPGSVSWLTRPASEFILSGLL